MTDRLLSGTASFRLLLAAVLVLLAGCRSYGGHYDEEVIYGELVRATDAFADDLERRRADLDAVAQAAADQPSLQPSAARYSAGLLVHEAALADARATTASLEGSGDYRALKQAFGAVVMNHRMVDRYYRGVFAGMTATDTVAAHAARFDEQSRYFVVPPFYNRLRYTGEQESFAAAARRISASPGTRPSAPAAADSMAAGGPATGEE